MSSEDVPPSPSQDGIEEIDVSTLAAAAPPAAPAPFTFSFGAPADVTTDLSNLTLGDGGDDDDDDDEEEDEEDEEGEDAAAMEAIMAALSEPVRARVEKLKELENEHAAIFAQYEAERCALEMKYQALYAGIYDKRADIITGRAEDTGAAAAAVSSEASTESTGDSKALKGVGELDGIPKFWLQAMVHRAILTNLLHQTDVEALSFLEDIRSVDQEDMGGFELQFIFAENPYFTNRVLTKAYKVPNMLKDEEPMLEKVTGCEIDWKPNMSLTYDEKTKKQRAKKGKNKGQTRIVVEKIAKPSFFTFFDSLDVEKMEECQDQDEAEELMDRFNMDYTAACFFRSEFIPHAVLNFTGEAEDDDDSDDEDYDDGDDDDDDDDDDDEDEDEDNDDDDEDDGSSESRRSKRRTDGGRKGGGLSRSKGGALHKQPGHGGAADQQECKQS